ncbi:hypothetical protein T05_16040 [Trichinella murrelli]|uniref:Uncharacterized protein n=1 Tax=Trichinella murrelli TaxID=144512 RepID=A0A0V0TZY0_9BILA|nr:hypothetical protein T05_16040 [Trichinella murrelli]
MGTISLAYITYTLQPWRFFCSFNPINDDDVAKQTKHRQTNVPMLTNTNTIAEVDSPTDLATSASQAKNEMPPMNRNGRTTN